MFHGEVVKSNKTIKMKIVKNLALPINTSSPSFLGHSYFLDSCGICIGLSYFYLLDEGSII